MSALRRISATVFLVVGIFMMNLDTLIVGERSVEEHVREEHASGSEDSSDERGPLLPVGIVCIILAVQILPWPRKGSTGQEPGEL